MESAKPREILQDGQQNLAGETDDKDFDENGSEIYFTKWSPTSGWDQEFLTAVKQAVFDLQEKNHQETRIDQLRKFSVDEIMNNIRRARYLDKRNPRKFYYDQICCCRPRTRTRT